MDLIKETVLMKLAKKGYRPKEEGLDPDMGGPSQELEDFCKTVYPSECTRMNEKSCERIREGNTIYIMLSGVKSGYGAKHPCYLYRIEQSAPLQEDYYWYKWESCTWESEYTWSGEMKPEYTWHATREKGWWHEESINIGKQSLRLAGQEYVPSRVPGLSEPKYPSHYDDRVKIKYPYSRRIINMGGPHDFAFLWNLTVTRWNDGDELALKVLKAQEEANRRSADPAWQAAKEQARTLIQKGQTEPARKLIQKYLSAERQRS